MTGVELILMLQAISNENKTFVEKELHPFSEEQLNWKPNPTTWSLNQIFAHLNVYGRFYHPSFEKSIESTKFKTPTQNFVSSPLGAAAWKSMKLGKAKNIKRKFKAIAAYNPNINPDLLNGRDKEDFIEGQNELLQLLEKSKSINIRKVKTGLSISKIIKFRLGDAMSFVVYHNQRHIQQAKNVIAHPKFPKQ